MENPKHNIDISNFSEEVISENDLPSLLYSLESQSIQHIQSNDIPSALASLKRSEEIMESISAQGGLLPSNLIISTLNNIAYCYQEQFQIRLNDWKKSLIYIDACFYNAKNLDFIKGKISHSEDKIRKNKFIAKLALHYSQTLSTLEKHKKSLKYSNLAYKYSCKAITETMEYFQKYKHVVDSKGKALKSSKAYLNKQILMQRAFPMLEAIEEFLKKGIIKKVDMRSALGIKGYPEWITQFNISEILAISPIKGSEFSSGLGIQAEFTKDYLFYKIALIAISLFLIGQNYKKIGKADKGYHFCNSSFKFLSNFFNEESPALQEIAENTKITEEMPQQSRTKLKKQMRRNKSMHYNITKFNIHSTSISKIKSVYERPSSESSHRGNYFREGKRRVVASELKLNVE